MKYLCLIYNDEKKVESAPRELVEQVVHECIAYDSALQQQGKLVASERLQPVAAAKTLRFDGGRASVTDGPFAETKEQLGGFYLIDAANMEEALRIARELPPARFGSVEVRPIMEYR